MSFLKNFCIVFILLFVLSSCSKEPIVRENTLGPTVNANTSLLKSNDLFHIELDYGSVSSIFEGQRLDSIFEFQRTDPVHKFTRTVMLDTTEFIAAEISSVQNNRFNLNVNGTDIHVSNVSISEDTLAFKAKLPLSSHTINFEGYDSNGELACMINEFRNGGEIEQRVWPLIFGAACLVAAFVDAYCNEQIANDVADCTANCMPSVVGPCGAECVYPCD